ncbi:MAG: sensor histidine kinase [Phycisphaerales bacterium]
MTQTENDSIPTKPRGLLSGMRIRKKLIILHTLFSVGLGVLLLIAIRPAMTKVIDGADQDAAGQMLEILIATNTLDSIEDGFQSSSVQLRWIDESDPDIPASVTQLAKNAQDHIANLPMTSFAGGLVYYQHDMDRYLIIRSRSTRARYTIQLVYMLVILTLIAGHVLVASALEVFVLPQHVYEPIQTILDADEAVRSGNRENEIIPERAIPADEIGSIMISRNQSIQALRTNQQELAHALDRLEHTAADLHKKNHLLETARKNLEGADRLASLGMMSAGIAHELNTPLAVVKGLVEKLDSNQELSPPERALLVRVVGRLEKLSDGLLDFARVRPPKSIETGLQSIITESITLVKLDRQDAISMYSISIESHVDPAITLCCDPDRLLQVFVNLIRNAVDALVGGKISAGKIAIDAQIEQRDGVSWVHVSIKDNGPGIDPLVIDRLFEPFVSSRLDAKGTGLGLAVANGIIREHGGLLVATNSPTDTDYPGAIFEVVLPEKSNNSNT